MTDSTPVVLKLSPPPLYDKFLSEDGMLTQPWQDWISQLQISMNQLVNGASSVFYFTQKIEAGPTYKLNIASTFSDEAVKSVDLTLT